MSDPDRRDDRQWFRRGVSFGLGFSAAVVAFGLGFILVAAAVTALVGVSAVALGARGPGQAMADGHPLYFLSAATDAQLGAQIKAKCPLGHRVLFQQVDTKGYHDANIECIAAQR